MDADEVWRSMLGEREMEEAERIIQRDLQLHIAAGREFNAERIDWYRYGLVCGMQLCMRLFSDDREDMVRSIRKRIQERF